MTQPTTRWELFRTPLFLGSVLLLAINDWIVKEAYPSWLSGKLSDFGGVTALGVVAVALLPRHQLLSLGAVGFVFALWKSPLVTPAIEGWNAISPFPIGRVADATDLLALLALPIVFHRARSSGYLIPWRPLESIALSGFALLAIATSRISPEYQRWYETNVQSYRLAEPLALTLTQQKDTLIKLLEQSFTLSSSYGLVPWTGEQWSLHPRAYCCHPGSPEPNCDRFSHARLAISDEDAGSSIFVYEIVMCDKARPVGRSQAKRLLEDKIRAAVAEVERTG